MLTEIMIGAIQGFAHVLADRFLNRGQSSASIRSVVDEVSKISEFQRQDRTTLIELKHMLSEALARADGFEVCSREILFTPTPRTPDAASALLNLDFEISRLRLDPTDAAGDERSTMAAGVGSPARAADPSSIFYRLDEEIAEQRRGEGGGR